MKIKLLLYYLLVLGVTIVVMACSIKEPQMPKWNTSLNLPLGEYKFTAMDLVKDSTIFDIREADSLIMIDISGDIEKQIIDTTELSIEGVDTVTSVSIDTVYIDSLDLLRVPDSVLTMGKIAPDLYDLIGSSIPIGSTSPVIEPVSLASGDFDSVHVTSGYVKLNINNNLPVAIASGSVLRIYSHPHADGDDSLLAAITIDNDILPGNSLPPKTVPLVYDWLISPVCIHFELETRASDGEVEITQDLLDNQGIGISLTFKDIKADQATSRLSAHDYTWEGAVEIEEDSVKLYAGKIHKGLIHFDIMNDLPVSGDVRIEILNFRKEDMSIVYEEFILLSEQNNPKDITLDDIYIVYIDEDGSPVVDSDVPLDSIHYKIYLHQEKYDDPITLMAGDSMGVTISMDSLKFQWLKAELVERTEIEIEPTETTGISDYEGFDGEIEFNDLALQINIFNEFELGNVDFTLNLWGYREEDGVVVEDMQITPLITDSIRPGENLFSITDADTDGKISQLVNMMPTRIVIDGEASIEGLVKIELGKGIYGDYTFSAPFEVRITEPLKLESDPFIMEEDDLGKDLRKAIEEDRIQNLELYSQIINELPLGGKMLLCFTDDTAMVNIFDTAEVPLYIELDHFGAAEVDDNGFVENATIKDKFLNISSDDISIFSNPPLKWGYKVEIDTTTAAGNDGYIKLQSFNSATVKGNLNFKLKIDEDLFDN